MVSDGSLFQACCLAVIQGLTEFLPVSSSGHLVLIRHWLGWSDAGGLVFDTILHAGSLAAILLYFWHEWRAVIRGYLQPTGADDAWYRRLPWLLLAATVPVIVAGPLLKPFLESETMIRNTSAVGLSLIATALWFWVCERVYAPVTRPLGFAQAVFIGCLQIVALLPGASRSGWTAGAGMAAGQTREAAVRFSFFMAIPAIAGAIVFQVKDILKMSALGLQPPVLVAGFLISFLVSLGAIHFCLRFFRTHTLKGFAVYVAVVGALTLLI